MARRLVKLFGSSLKFCLVAEEESDVYHRFGPAMEWDMVAGNAVTRTAGGIVSTIDDSSYLHGNCHYRNTAFIASGKWGP